MGVEVAIIANPDVVRYGERNEAVDKLLAMHLVERSRAD
jgi:hypothetical protein